MSNRARLVIVATALSAVLGVLGLLVAEGQAGCQVEQGCSGDAIEVVGGLVCLGAHPSFDQALQCAIAVSPNNRGGTNMPAPIALPHGEHALFDEVRVDRPIILDGNGASLSVESGKTGLYLDTNADRSIVRALLLVGPSQQEDPATYPPHYTIGIRSEAHGVHYEDIHLRNLTTGLQVRSGSAYPGVNSNFGRASGLWVTWCQIGVDVDGPDSNGWLLTAVECQSTGQCGVDSSFLGNTWLVASSHAAAIEPAFLFDDEAAYHLLLSGYLEGNDTLEIAGGNSLIVGGNAPTSVTAATSAERVGMGHADLRFERYPDGQGFFRAPGYGLDTAFSFGHLAESNHRWDVRRYSSGNPKWRIARDGASGTFPYGWTAEGHSAGPGRYILGSPL